MHNEGIVNIGPGQINAKQINSGRNSMAIFNDGSGNYESSYEDIHVKIKELIKLMQQNEEMVSDSRKLIESLANIDQELKKDKPNKITIKDILKELTSGVSSVATLANAVKALEVAILSILK